MSVSESQSGRDPWQEEVLTLTEAAAHLRVPEAELAELADRNGVPGRKVGGEWRFLRKGLNNWLVSRGHAHCDACQLAQHWLMESPFAEELLLVLEERLLHNLKHTAPPAPKPGSKHAVLQYFGAFQDENDLEGKLTAARKRREAGG